MQFLLKYGYFPFFCYCRLKVRLINVASLSMLSFERQQTIMKLSNYLSNLFLKQISS